MTVNKLIKSLQSYYKYYESQIYFEDAIPIVDYVYTKEMGFLLFADDDAKTRVTPHELLIDLHKVWNKEDTVLVIVDNCSYTPISINSRKYPDEPGYLNITC